MDHPAAISRGAYGAALPQCEAHGAAIDGDAVSRQDELRRLSQIFYVGRVRILDILQGHGVTDTRSPFRERAGLPFAVRF